MSEFPDTWTEELLIEWVHKGREEFDQLWKDLSGEVMLRRPGVYPEWSVKDLIAHLTWWESYTMARCILLAGGEEVFPMEEFDAANALIWAQHKNLPLEFVLESWSRNLPLLGAHIRLFSIEELNSEELYKGHGRSIARLIGGNTFGHYEEHGVDLKTFIQSLEV